MHFRAKGRVSYSNLVQSEYIVDYTHIFLFCGVEYKVDFSHLCSKIQNDDKIKTHFWNILELFFPPLLSIQIYTIPQGQDKLNGMC